MIQLDQIDLNHKRVLVRVDLNVPFRAGKILDDARLKAILPTLQFLLKANARIILLSHLGRPEAGLYTEVFSLKPIADRLSQLLNQSVRLVQDWLAGITILPREIVLCENVRFNQGEMHNDEALAKRMAALCDVFMMDAFATAHRAEASTVGIAKYAPLAVAGPLLTAELKALSLAMQDPKRPLVAIVGGAKVSDKCAVLGSLLEQVDTLILGGGIANTFIVAQGGAIGDSLQEPGCIPMAKQLLKQAQRRSVRVIIPVDAIVANALLDTAVQRVSDLSDMTSDEKIGDVGPQTLQQISDIIHHAGTIIWNGPLGVFEIDAFGRGTQVLAEAIANAPGFSIAGGGQTLAAIDKYGVSEKISYLSTGGGAFLAYLEGKTLPAIAALR